MAKDISKTLIVGLGGTGESVILDIKKQLLRRYGEIPKLVKFLEIDTDDLKPVREEFSYYYGGERHVDYRYQILRPEHHKINRPGLEVVKNDRICTEKLNIPQLARTYNMLLDAGANGYRVVGRAHFLNHSQDIIGLLQGTINNLKQESLLDEETAKGYNLVNQGDVTVYVIASLAGGTGSSAFMDISRMLQIAGINVETDVNQTRDRIFGMFFLPNFFEGYADTNNIKINTYTALSELDYTLGLADTARYPEGSIELDNDRNDYQGYINHRKKVIYTATYLIDACGRHNRTLADAASHVASFIAGSIAADSNALRSGYSNSQHKMYHVDGKYQNYSGLGYCELRFDRQELVKYLLNKKLITVLEQFKKGNIVETMYQVACKFINDYGLNEGVKNNTENKDDRSELNQLTDAIINMTDRRLTEITMAAVNVGKGADTSIETNKTTYLTSIGTVTSEIVNEYATQKEVIFTALNNMLTERQAGKGFISFPDLAKQLRTAFIEMKKGLEDEIEQHKAEYVKIERDLKALNTSIKNNSSKGVLWGTFGNKTDNQANFIRTYRNKVIFNAGTPQNPTLAWLKVDTARKTEAVAIYEKLIEIVEGFYNSEIRATLNGQEEIVSGTFVDTSRLYENLIDKFVGELTSYQPPKAAVKETVYADAYFKDYFMLHEQETTSLTDHDQAILDEYIGSIFAGHSTIDSDKLAEMRRELLRLLPADGLIRKIQEERMSIDELFIKCFGTYGDIKNPGDVDAYPQLQILKQVETLFYPLWQYLNFTGHPSSMSPSKHMIAGVCNTNNNIFNTENGYNQAINTWNLQTIGLGDPDKIVFMLTETGVPAFKLMGADAWANEFNQKKDHVYTFSDKRLEFIDMISPAQIDEENEIAWAYGWLFDLIHVDRGRIWVKPTLLYCAEKGYARIDESVDYFRNLHHIEGIDLDKCHRYFIRDMGLSQDIYNQVIQKLLSDKAYNAVRIKHWVNDDEITTSRKKQNLTPQERKLIDIEKLNLAKLFTNLSDYGIRLSEDGKIYLIGEDATIEENERRYEAAKAAERNQASEEGQDI